MPHSLNRFKWFSYVVLLFVALVLNFQQLLLEQYMRFCLRNDHIVVSFSTTPHRIHEIESKVQTILRQNIKVDAVYIAIPYVFKRDNTPYTIPEWLQKHKELSVIRTEDYGPATKLLGVLKHIPLDPNTIIITVDDDIHYPSNTILHLAYKAKQTPSSAIGLSGRNPSYDENGILISNNIGGFTRVREADAKASVLQGFAGIAYRRSFFNEDIFAIVNAPRECINSDDVYLAFYLARYNIDRIVLKNKFMYDLKVDYVNEIGLRSDALHQLIPTPCDKHRVCLAYLKGLYPNVTF